MTQQDAGTFCADESVCARAGARASTRERLRGRGWGWWCLYLWLRLPERRSAGNTVPHARSTVDNAAKRNSG